MVGSIYWLYWCDWDSSEWPEFLTGGVIDKEHGVDSGWLIEREIGQLSEIDSWINWVHVRGIADIGSWTLGRALYYTCINWLNVRSFAIELS